MAQPTIVRRLGGILFSLFFFFMLNVVLEWQDGLRSTDSNGFQVICFPRFFLWMFIMGYFEVHDAFCKETSSCFGANGLGLLFVQVCDFGFNV
jgi:hypothetical protein